MTFFWEGLGLGASLIIAIGAQNAYVLSLGIRRNHHIPAALICMTIDMILVAVGVAGVGSFFASQQWLLVMTTMGGALFLLVLAAKSFMAIFESETLAIDQRQKQSLNTVIKTTLAVSLLNPHVYLDTVVLLGTYSAGIPTESKWTFATGAALASILWFNGLAWFATKLAPIFAKPVAWKWLDAAIGTIMLLLATKLTLTVFSGNII